MGGLEGEMGGKGGEGGRGVDYKDFNCCMSMVSLCISIVSLLIFYGASVRLSCLYVCLLRLSDITWRECTSIVSL